MSSFSPSPSWKLSSRSNMKRVHLSRSTSHFQSKKKEDKWKMLNIPRGSHHFPNDKKGLWIQAIKRGGLGSQRSWRSWSLYSPHLCLKNAKFSINFLKLYCFFPLKYKNRQVCTLLQLLMQACLDFQFFLKVSDIFQFFKGVCPKVASQADMFVYFFILKETKSETGFYSLSFNTFSLFSNQKKLYGNNIAHFCCCMTNRLTAPITQSVTNHYFHINNGSNHYVQCERCHS